METVHCEDCGWFHFPDSQKDKARCRKGEKVRFYNPKSNNYMDDDYGWKKKCDKFKLSKRVYVISIGG